MDTQSTALFYAQAETIRKDDINPELIQDRISEMRRAIEVERKHEQEIKRIADDRRNMVVEHGIDSSLQRLMNVKP